MSYNTEYGFSERGIATHHKHKSDQVVDLSFEVSALKSEMVRNRDNATTPNERDYYNGSLMALDRIIVMIHKKLQS